MGKFSQTFRHIREFPRDFWVIIIATLISQIGNMAFVYLILYLTEHLHFSLTQASYAFFAFSLSLVLSGLAGGSLIDKIGTARILVPILFFNSLVLFIIPFIDSFILLLIACSLWGFIYGLFRPASSTFISLLSPSDIYKLTFSVYRLVLNLGMSIGPLLGGYIAQYHSYPAIFFFNSISNLLAGLIVLLGLVNSKWFSYRPAGEHKFNLNLSYLKNDKALSLFVLGMVPVSMVFFQHESTLSVYLINNLKYSISFYGLLFTINTLCIVFFELTLNVATINWPYKLNFILGSIFITLGFFGFLFSTAQWYVITLTIMWTIGEMILYPSASSYVADIASEQHRASYMSMYSTCSNLGLLLGPWGGAILMQYFGVSILWSACGVLGLISIWVFAYIPEPNKPISSLGSK